MAHFTIVDIQDMLRCLAEADSGRVRPELCEGRYAAVVYDPEDEDGLEEEEPDWHNDTTGLRLVGEASSLYDALDLLAHALAAEYEDDMIEELLDENSEAEGEEVIAAAVQEIQTDVRRLLAVSAASFIGPMDIVTDDHWRDSYLGDAPILFPGARFVFLASAAPPHHDEAFAILELQPTGTPTPTDRALMDAKDAATVEAALADGANVTALDDRGMSPLHHAVAHRNPEVVAALLKAGADPCLQAEFGNAPHFATLDRDRTVQAAARRIEDDQHWRILRMLIDAHAPLNVGDRTGAKLLDLAIATRPYPEQAISFLTEQGARTAQLTSRPLTELLRSLPYESDADMEILLNEVRFLLEAGADPEGALHALLGTYGYYEHEVSGQPLLAFVDEILRHGARDTRDSSGRTALDRAERWYNNGNMPNYEPVVTRLRAHHADQEQ